MRLLLVGGGHAMLPTLCAAQAWTRRGLDVTLLNDHSIFYYSGMVPEYLGGVYHRSQVCIDLRHLCARSGVGLVVDRAACLSTRGRFVEGDSGTRYAFDLAAFDIGACNPALPVAAVPTKPLFHVEALEAQIRAVLSGPQGSLALVIAGGGAAGVEIALNVSARFQAAHRRPDLHLFLVEPGEHLLPTFPRGMGAFAGRLLQQRGVSLRTGTSVDVVMPGQVQLSNGQDLPADAVLWAAGSTAPPLFKRAGLPCDREGFVRVSEKLQVVDRPFLFAAGDCAHLDGHDLAKVGVHAVKQGTTLRDNLGAALSALEQGVPLQKAPLQSFRPYPLAPLILSTGAAEGLITAGPVWARGGVWLRLKHFVDRRWMRRYNPAAWPTARLGALADARAPLA